MTRVFDDEPDDTVDKADEGNPTPQPSGLGPTTLMQLAVATLAGAVVGWFVVSTMQQLKQIVPVTPWTMSLMMAVVAGAAAISARVLKRRLEADRHEVSTEQALMALVVGKTMVFTGALLAGGHVVYALMNVGQWAIPMPRERVIFGAIAVVASALFAGAGWLLERACRTDS